MEVEEDRESIDEASVVESRLLTAFNSVRYNIREGQKQKGKLTLQDCRLLVSAEKTLDKFLKRLAHQDTEKGKDENGAKNENEDKVFATDEIYGAYRVLLASLEVLQSTGIFSVEGSVELLDWMEEIAAGLDEVKDPAIRMRELKEKTKTSKKKKGKD